MYKGDEIVMDILKRQEQFSSDNKEWVTYREENELANEQILGLKRAKEEGIKQGKTEGIIQRNYL